MLLLENYPALRQLLEILGLTVFHTLWSGCLLLVLLTVALKIIPTHLAKVRFTVSLLALQLLLLLFIALFFQQWNRVATTAEPAVNAPLMPTPPEEVLLPSKPMATVPDSPSTQAVNWLAVLHRWSPWWAALWLIGCIVHAAQLVQGLRYTHRLRVQAQPLSGKWERQFTGLKQRLGITKRVAFLQSCQATVPLTFGWLKPVVLLPAGVLMQLSPGQVEMIVLHELAHIRRHDYLWSLCQSLAEVVLFYHPAYWYIAHVLEREREYACDQMTISITQQPHIYARTLLQLAATPSLAYGLPASGKRDLSARIQRIVTPAYRKRNAQVLPVLILVGLLGLASVTFALQLQQSGMDNLGKGQYLSTTDSTDTDYGSSFEEVMKRLSELKSISSAKSLNEIYDSAMPLDQRLNHYGGKMGFDYSSPDVLYLVDGKIRNPRSIKHSEVVDFEVFHHPERAGVKGVDISEYTAIVKAYTEKDSARTAGLHSTHRADWWVYGGNVQEQTLVGNTLEKKNSKSPPGQIDRWLYIVNDQIQITRPAFLDQDYRADGWDTRVVPGASWWIKAHLTEEQQALVDEYKYTGIVFITNKGYRASQQGYLIHGTVTEMQHERPLPGIPVRIKGKGISTTTDAAGRYQLAATSMQDTVEFLLKDHVAKIPIEGRREVSISTYGTSAARKKRSMEKMQKTLRTIEQRLQQGGKIEKLPTQLAQDSVTENTLVIVDGVPQYGKTLDEVDREMKQNSLYSYHSLTAHGADSSKAILKALQAEGYDRVVSIDSWASLKKDGMIAPTRLEEFLHVFPNPTQDWFTLQFFIGEDLPITITVLDDQGQTLTTLTDRTYPAGSHEVGWDASDQKPGVYFVQWVVGEQRVTRKVVIE